MAKDENMDWEVEVPHLAKLDRTNPFSVPQNYFNELPASIETQIFLPTLGQSKNTGFFVPSGYFDNLAEQIEGKLSIETLKNIVAEDGFATPANYFHGLNQSILDKTVGPKSQSKIIRLFQNNLFKYASAACLVTVMASGYYYNQYLKTSPVIKADLAAENMLYDIDENIIREHVRESQTVSNVNLTDAEIENYILNNLSSTDISTNL